MQMIVTGGAGFIGSAVCRYLIERHTVSVLNVDKLTYASNLRSLDAISASPRYRFVKADICDIGSMNTILREFEPDAIIHLAAESHVDRSIADSTSFVNSNIIGTYTLLESTRHYWQGLPEDRRTRFRFLHVSTDEVYGSLGADGLFHEDTRYDPSSPYSASKAASDHLALAWHRTYGLPIIIANSSNNYGPYQFPEKLIPRIILNALHLDPLPVYGDGRNIRDWLYVDDHVQALWLLLIHGQAGRKYNIGSRTELNNLAVVHKICEFMDEQFPMRAPHGRLIAHVADRPGHDRRYAIDPTRLETEIGWRPSTTFDTGMRQTVRWYIENAAWWEPMNVDKAVNNSNAGRDP